MPQIGFNWDPINLYSRAEAGLKYCPGPKQCIITEQHLQHLQQQMVRIDWCVVKVLVKCLIAYYRGGGMTIGIVEMDEDEFVSGFEGGSKSTCDGSSSLSSSCSDYEYLSCEEYVSRRRREVSCGLFDCRRDDIVRRSASSDDEDESYIRRRDECLSLDRLPVKLAKQSLLAALDASRGEPRDPRVADAVRVLADENRLWTSESDSPLKEATGRWKAVTRADFPGSVGRSGRAYAYTLGRMSFGLFSPGDVLMSVEECHVVVRPSYGKPSIVPESVKPHAEIRTYNIEVRFTVLDDRAKGLRGMLTTYGYCARADSRAGDAAHRLAVWFVGGDLRPDGHADDRWTRLFSQEAESARKTRSLVTRATLWFVSKALGIELGPVQPDGVQCYKVAKPVTGFVDVLFADDDLRVTRGNRNSTVVMKKINKH